MNDNLKKATPSQRLREIPADLINTVVDLKQIVDRTQHIGGQGGGAPKYSQTMIRVKNTSGVDQNQYAILGIDGILFSPTDNLTSFKNQPCLTCITPMTAAHSGGLFVILAEPIKAGEIGWAVIDGVTQVKLEVTASGDAYADVTNANATKLTTAATGSVRILYKEAGTGEKWGIVALRDGADDFLGELQEQVHKMVSQNQDGAGFIQAHALP